MHPQLQTIQQAADGLLYMSETDAAFEIVELSKDKDIVTQLKQLAGKDAGAIVEEITLPHFFRNHVKTKEGDTAEQKQRAARFVQLQTALEQSLNNIRVFRMGEVQIDVFIIGTLADGNIAGLKTFVVET